jgi:hypothetical protein
MAFDWLVDATGVMFRCPDNAINTLQISRKKTTPSRGARLRRRPDGRYAALRFLKLSLSAFRIHHGSALRIIAP